MIQDYLKAIRLLCELIGLHPREAPVNEEWCEMLREAGWRPFKVERVTPHL